MGSYLFLAKFTFGEDSPQVGFIEDTIARSPNGEDEEVIADERQMILLLASLGKTI